MSAAPLQRRVVHRAHPGVERVALELRQLLDRPLVAWHRRFQVGIQALGLLGALFHRLRGDQRPPAPPHKPTSDAEGGCCCWEEGLPRCRRCSRCHPEAGGAAEKHGGDQWWPLIAATEAGPSAAPTALLGERPMVGRGDWCGLCSTNGGSSALQLLSGRLGAGAHSSMRTARYTVPQGRRASYGCQQQPGVLRRVHGARGGKHTQPT